MKKLFSILTLLGSLAMPAIAQTEESNWYTTLNTMDSSQLTLLIILGVILVVIVLLLILMIYLMSFLTEVVKKENPNLVNEPSWWESFKERFVTGKLDAVGGKEEKAKMMSDHSYDGITELDNFMPPWLQWVFIGSIGFAIIYFIDYTILGTGLTGEEEYQEELRLETIAAEGRKASMLAGID